MRALVLLGVFGLLGALCLTGCPQSQQRAYGSGTDFSNIPCRDNCGNDAQCMANCVPTSESMPAAVPAEPVHSGKLNDGEMTK